MAVKRRNFIGAVIASASIGRMPLALAPSLSSPDAELGGWLRWGIEVLQPRRACNVRATRRSLLVVSRWLALLMLSTGCVMASAQQSTSPVATGKNTPAVERWDGTGDSPANPGPLAHHLSAELTPAAIDQAVRKVGDWQLERARPYFSKEWSFAVLYIGIMSAAETLHDQGYQDAMLEMGKKFDWQLGPREIDPTYVAHGQAAGQTYDTDNQGLAQTYIELYGIKHRPAMLAATKAQFDQLMTVKDRPDAPAWWFCDDLFVAAPAWMELYKATSNKAYLDYMDRQWWVTSKSLYDSKEKLYFRDSSYFSKREKNGKKVFWSRGNGWVLAGYARVLDGMPKDYPSRPRYIKQFKQMASRIASLQRGDGLWRPALLDPEAYPSPEISGSALFIYGLAWGVDHGILDRKKYLPVVEAGWKGLLSDIYADGRLGSIQAVASEPGGFAPSSSYVYGVGAFLLAGSEMKALAK
jgi:unsaturated rhamnogalacturonyl hydrolase